LRMQPPATASPSRRRRHSQPAADPWTQSGSLWAASRTVDACGRVFNGCLSCLRGGPSRSALLWF